MAVSAMHYTAMAAAYFVRDGDAAIADTLLAPAFLASVVLVVTTAIILLTLVATFLARPTVMTFARIYWPVAVLLFGWGIAAWMGAGHYSAHMASLAYRDGQEQARRQANDVGDDIEERKQKKGKKAKQTAAPALGPAAAADAGED